MQFLTVPAERMFPPNIAKAQNDPGEPLEFKPGIFHKVRQRLRRNVHH